MKDAKQLINIVKHKSTGAKVPVIIRKISKNNIIEEYSEYTENRKYFTLDMLQNRWNKDSKEVLDLLNKYQIPAHVRYKDIQLLNPDQSPSDAAIFFEEYIYGLEKKENLPHKKIKPK